MRVLLWEFEYMGRFSNLHYFAFKNEYSKVNVQPYYVNHSGYIYVNGLKFYELNEIKGNSKVNVRPFYVNQNNQIKLKDNTDWMRKF